MNEPGLTGVYYDEKGHPMLGSAAVRDPKFQDRVVADARPAIDDSKMKRGDLSEVSPDKSAK
jgi:hypothetical protein